MVTIVDWHASKVLDWRTSNTLEADFCVEALNEAIARSGPPEIMNTDGLMFGASPSPLSEPNPVCASRWMEKAGVGRWIAFYNRKRPHSALGGRPPAKVCLLRIDESKPDHQEQRVC